MARRVKGSGHLYQRGKFWYAKYVVNGRVFREALHETSKAVAQASLNKILAEQRPSAKFRVTALAEEFLKSRDAICRPSTAAWFRRTWTKHLQPRFGAMRAENVSTATLEEYIKTRRAKAADPTVKAEMRVLKMIFQHALDNEKLYRIPKFPKPSWNTEPRRGKINDAQFAALMKKCEEPWLAALLALYFHYGFRKQELLTMRVHQVDTDTATLSLAPSDTKSKRARVTQLDPDGEIFGRVKALAKGKKPDDFLFTRADGKQVQDFRGAWDNLVAGLKTGSGKAGKVTVHDLRRSAVTRTQTLGIPQSLAQEVSGHLTAEVFNRYVVTDDAIRREVSRRIEQNHKGTNKYTRREALKQVL